MTCNETRAVRRGNVSQRVHWLAKELRVDKANSCISFAAICPTGGMDADLGSIRVVAMRGPLDCLWETDASPGFLTANTVTLEASVSHKQSVFAVRNTGLHISPSNGHATLEP